MSIRITMTGDKELDRALKNVPDKLEKKIVRKALRKAAAPVLATARQNVPVLTGALKRSLKIRALKRSRKGRLGVRVVTGEGFFKGDTFYGGFIEFGTRYPGGSSGFRIPPKPFMRPAYDQNKERVRQIFVSTIKQLITEAVNEVRQLSFAFMAGAGR